MADNSLYLADPGRQPKPEDPIAQARQPVMDALAQTFAVYGWPEVVGRIYGQLYLENAPMTQDELCAQLGVSKATISTNLRTLESLHLVYRVGNGGHEGGGGRPRVSVQAEQDFMKVMQELLRHNARREAELMSWGLGQSRKRLEELRCCTDAAMAHQARIDLDSLARFEAYTRWGERILWLVQNVERMQRFVSSFWQENGRP